MAVRTEVKGPDIKGSEVKGSEIKGSEAQGSVNSETAIRRLSDELRRVRTVAIFLARGVLKMQRSRQQAIALPPEDCKTHLVNEFPILQGPKAEAKIQRFAQLDDISADRAEQKYLGQAYIREGEGWIPVTAHYPKAEPNAWSRSVLVLLDTGGIAISSYLAQSAHEGQWLNLEEGFGTVTHWHELPPLPDEAEQEKVLKQVERREISSAWKKKAQRPQRRLRSLEEGLWSSSNNTRQSSESSPASVSTSQPVEPPLLGTSPFEIPQSPVVAPAANDDDINWI